ncbi:MAG: hypothetical protein ABW217_14615, partial [Polyangiaceae bacterium]
MNSNRLRALRSTPLARTWLPLALLGAIACFVLFYNYGSGTFKRWDEGLYGQFARNALTYHDYLLPLDTAGNYSREPFSKPPLSFLLVALSFKLFDPSIASLRLPFTLGTLGLVLVCFAWGNDIARRLSAGRWLAFVWGLFVLLGEWSMIWGRYAVIEDVFVLFTTLALWLHSRSLARSTWWSVLAGFSLCFAFLIKQLAVGIAILPMFLLELLHLREQGLRRTLGRTLLWAAPTVVVALTWAFLAYGREGERFAGMLWTFALVQRFQGYQGTVHFNTFNRIAGILDDASWPFSWLLGVLGLCVFAAAVLSQRRPQARAQLAPVLSFLTGVLVLENTSKSLLPWYVYSFVPSLALGLAWVTTQGYRAFAASWRRPGFRLSTQHVALAGLAAGILFLALAETLRTLVSLINVAVLLLGLAWLGWRGAQRVRGARWLPSTVFAGCLALLTLAHFRHGEYRQSPGTFEVLMGLVGEAQLTQPVISPAVSKSDIEYYEPTTL